MAESGYEHNAVFATKGAVLHQNQLAEFFDESFAELRAAVDRHITAEDMLFSFVLAESGRRAGVPGETEVRGRRGTRVLVARAAGEDEGEQDEPPPSPESRGRALGPHAAEQAGKKSKSSAKGKAAPSSPNEDPHDRHIGAAKAVVGAQLAPVRYNFSPFKILALNSRGHTRDTQGCKGYDGRGLVSGLGGLQPLSDRTQFKRGALLKRFFRFFYERGMALRKEGLPSEAVRFLKGPSFVCKGRLRPLDLGSNDGRTRSVGGSGRDGKSQAGSSAGAGGKGFKGKTKNLRALFESSRARSSSRAARNRGKFPSKSAGEAAESGARTTGVYTQDCFPKPEVKRAPEQDKTALGTVVVGATLQHRPDSDDVARFAAVNGLDKKELLTNLDPAKNEDLLQNHWTSEMITHVFTQAQKEQRVAATPTQMRGLPSSPAFGFRGSLAGGAGGRDHEGLVGSSRDEEEKAVVNRYVETATLGAVRRSPWHRSGESIVWDSSLQSTATVWQNLGFLLTGGGVNFRDLTSAPWSETQR